MNIEVDLDTDSGRFLNAGAAVCLCGFLILWQGLIESRKSLGS